LTRQSRAINTEGRSFHGSALLVFRSRQRWAVATSLVLPNLP